MRPMIKQCLKRFVLRSIDGYSAPLHLDSGGLLVYLRYGIAAHQLHSFTFAEGTVYISLEVNLN